MARATTCAGARMSAGGRMRARVIALGQSAAGDDGVGPAVLEELRLCGAGEGVELRLAAEDAALVALLDTDTPVIVVDAVLGEPVGEVLLLSVEDLDARGASLSTHGLGAARAIGLARALRPADVGPPIRIVAVTIARPRRHQVGLSAAVAAAVPLAAARVRELIWSAA